MFFVKILLKSNCRFTSGFTFYIYTKQFLWF